MTSTRRRAAILPLVALVILPAACGRLGPPVRSAPARAPQASAVETPGVEGAPASADEEEGVRK
jgi:hypothetical protein